MSHFTVLTSMHAQMEETSLKLNADLEAAPKIIQAVWGKRTFSALEAYVEDRLEDIMAPFCECTDEPEYIEFYAQDETAAYKSACTECVQMPDGTLVSKFEHDFCAKFCVEDGKVYQHDGKPSHCKKRTKKAKKMKAVKVPFKKLYKTYAEFMTEYCGYVFDEVQQAYGYYGNPNAQWDWYQVGGRWPFRFLVKEDCPSKIFGDRSWGWQDDEFAKAQKGPEGYIWVAGAKKSDIEWNLMKELYVKSETAKYGLYRKWIETDEQPEELHDLYRLRDDGIYHWSDLVYMRGETLPQHLERYGLGPDSKYAFDSYAFVSDGTWFASADMGWFGVSTNNKEPATWNDMLADFIAGVPDDHLLVSVDCHI